MKTLKALILAAAALLLPATANAQLAYTAGAVSLYAGPAANYPVVAVLDGGLGVSVQACTPDYSWCDVVAGGYRGWLYARDISYLYQGAYVPVMHYGAALGIGVVSFVIGNYWQQHYVGRPWYWQLPHWNRRPPPVAIHPRPPHAAPVHRPYVEPPHARSYARPQQFGPRERFDQGRTPVSRSQFQPPGANPRLAPAGARPGVQQRPTTGPGRGPRPR